jgi:hypothetical protein
MYIRCVWGLGLYNEEKAAVLEDIYGREYVWHEGLGEQRIIEFGISKKW